MTNKELIACLSQLDPNGEVSVVMHGCAYSVDNVEERVRRYGRELPSGSPVWTQINISTRRAVRNNRVFKGEI